ncbi:MAG: heavy metal-associated domain-containing protein [Acidobacteriota bacterium]
MNQPQRQETRIPRTTRLSVSGMSCASCARHVAQALDAIPGVRHVDVNLQQGEATVKYLAGSVDETALVAAVSNAGYEARVAPTDVGADDEPPKSASAGCSTSCCCG